MIKIKGRVKVNTEESFTGVVEKIIEWENPLSFSQTSGKAYYVKADDTKQIYKVPEELLTAI